MDLSTSTAYQQEIITTLDKPLMVAAGAGSGKTFTLTNRVVYALLPDSGKNGKPYLSSIDEVLVTTFTNKAAAELKSRIKSMLIKEGLVDESQKVESAWISTIHGVCSRILRENAFLLGIDPGFSVLDEAEADGLFYQAFIEVVNSIQSEQISSLSSEDIKSYQHLFSQYEIVNRSRNVSSLARMVRIILDKVKATTAGFEEVIYPRTNLSPAGILRSMIEIGSEYLTYGQAWKKPTKTDEKYLGQLQDALIAAQDYLSKNHDDSFDSKKFSPQEYISTFYAFPKTSLQYRAKKEDADFFKKYRLTYAELSEHVQIGLMQNNLRSLIGLSKLVDEAYRVQKGPLRFDNLDLLYDTVCCLEDHPDLCSYYQEKFKLIMIDEFQDTDQLQVDILLKLAKNDGSNITTVGDAQQSIYRFRGADVNVFHSFRSLAQERFPLTKFINLPDNFRSHRDVLAFVDTVFSHSALFGQHFLSLKSQGLINKENDPIFDDKSRISFDVFEARQKATVSTARFEAAQSIAKHFSDLREKGVSPNEMVILLSSMSHADIYIQALQDHGFESVLSGGSVFATSEEVTLIEHLLHWLVNPRDSYRLYNILSSPLFRLSDDALICLATSFNKDKHLICCDIAQSFLNNDVVFEAHEVQTEISHAQNVLLAFLRQARKQNLSDALRCLCVNSGWFARLESQGAKGLACAGNLYKAFHLVENLEQKQTGIASLANLFSDQLEVSKESPGLLSSDSSEFVRIMTVHASKGLEFPHVAIGEFKTKQTIPSKLIVDSIDGKTSIALRPDLPYFAKGIAEDLSSVLEQPYEDSDQLFSYNVLKSVIQSKEHEEQKRLFYVALTRASKSLYITYILSGNKSFDYSSKGILDELHQALQWEKSETAPLQVLSYGDSLKLPFSYKIFSDEVKQNQVSSLPLQRRQLRIDSIINNEISYLPCDNSDYQVCSYSSLKAAKPDESSIDNFVDDSEKTFARLVAEEFGCPIDYDSSIDLGLAFHRLAQRALEHYAASDKTIEIQLPSDAIQQFIAQQYRLSSNQITRLKYALDLWIQGDLTRRFASCQTIQCEVPFMVEVQLDQESFFLEGEIDALAYNDYDLALLFDYKTGGKDNEKPEDVYQKHLLQAQCYAYALLRKGFSAVEAFFIRVERKNPQTLKIPHIVTYRFVENDLETLESIIQDHYLAYKEIMIK